MIFLLCMIKEVVERRNRWETGLCSHGRMHVRATSRGIYTVIFREREREREREKGEGESKRERQRERERDREKNFKRQKIEVK